MLRLLIGLCLILVSALAQAASLDLSAYKNQVVLVDFWASWCAPCAASFPWLDAMQKHYGPQGLVVLTVNLDENRRDAEAFLQGLAFTPKVVYDPNGAIAQSYVLVAMPTSVLIDRRGTIRYRHNGFLESKVSDYEAHIRSLLLE